MAEATSCDGTPSLDGSGQALPGKEVLTFCPDLGPTADNAVGSGQPAQEELSIPLGDDAAVQQHHNPRVLATPDQPAEPLLQLEGRVRQQIVHEPIQPLFSQALESGRRDRL